MKKEILETLPSLLPMDFFSLECPIPYLEHFERMPKNLEKYALPDTSFLLSEEVFGRLSLYWNEEALMGDVEVNKALEEVRYPEVEEGDSLELFIDTRNIKTAGFATKFCHHLVLFPEAYQGIYGKELTHFRSEDAHPVLESLEEVEVHTEKSKRKYRMRFCIPKSNFCGFEPLSFTSLGFTYRLNGFRQKPQHFSVSSYYYNIAQQPSLWATLNLKKGNL